MEGLTTRVLGMHCSYILTFICHTGPHADSVDTRGVQVQAMGPADRKCPEPITHLLHWRHTGQLAQHSGSLTISSMNNHGIYLYFLSRGNMGPEWVSLKCG